MTKPTRPSFRAIIGHTLKHWREARGERQEVVALACRRWGLPWSANVIALIEAGRRHLTAEEFLLLPSALADLGGPATWSELLPPASQDRVQLTPTTDATIEALRQLIEQAEVDRDQFSTPHSRQREAWHETARQQMSPVKSVAVTDSLAVVGQDTVLEIDRKAARALKTTPARIVTAAWRTWKHSLMEERERLLTLAGAGLMPARRAQAVRGRITRTLLQQLKPLVTRRKRARRRR